MGNHNSGDLPKKSIQEHKLDGTYRPDRHNGWEQEKPVLVKPQGFIDDDFCTSRKVTFNRVAKLLKEQGQTTETDSMFVSILVETICQYNEALQIIRTEGINASVGRKNAVQVELPPEIRTLT